MLELKKVEHPLWKVLRELNYLTFESDNSLDTNMSIDIMQV